MKMVYMPEHTTDFGRSDSAQMTKQYKDGERRRI